jgi:hypothetical protein
MTKTFKFAGKTFQITKSKDWVIFLNGEEVMVIDRAFSLNEVKTIIREEA